MKITVTAERLLGASGMIEHPLLTIRDGVILDIQSLTPEDSARLPVTHRFPAGTIVPSYLDVHIHGCAGHDVMEGSAEAADAIGFYLARHGVGAYLPTTVTSPEDEILRALSGVARQIERRERGTHAGANPLGIHLEGPFLSHAKRGVHTAALLKEPSIPLFDRMWEAAEGRILLMTLAPELPGALDLIAYATALGVRCSLGHSDATVPESAAGRASGARSATHTFNAMSGLDHRDPGLTAYVLDEDELFSEIIADGIHVDPLIVRLYAKVKAADRVLLVTDGISATGMPDGVYKLGDMEVEVKEGRCTSGGALAGSVLTLDRGVENYMQFTGVGVSAAVNAASRNPAQMIGQDARYGTLETGRCADMTILSAAGEVLQSFLRGVPAGSPS